MRRRPRLAAAGVSGALLLIGSAAVALQPAERELLLRSLRAGEAERVEAAVGGLDSLPLVALEIEINLENGSFFGRARLDWRNVTGRPVEVLPYRLSSNGLHEDKPPIVRWRNVTACLDGRTTAAVAQRQTAATLFEVTLPRALAPGERVVLDGDLDGKLVELAPGATDPTGGGLGALAALMGGGASTARPGGEQYGTFACGDGICTLTGFAPEVPAFIAGRFDAEEGSGIGDPTYSEPVNVLLTVVAPSSVTVAATGVETGRVPAGGGRRRTTFAMAASREVGVVASSEFVTDETTVDGVRVRSLAKKSDRAAGKRALTAAKEALQALDSALGRYPWARLDVVEAALTGGAGGVEMPGLTLAASGFYQPPQGLAAMLGAGGPLGGGGGAGLWDEMLEFIVRHEVAHQWWHAQVGSHAQRHPWVDEPLAQWSALLATRRARGEAAGKRARDTQIALNYQAMGVLGGSDGRVARPAPAFSSPVEYAALVYGKAPLFYEAARKLVGENTLLSALRGFVSRFRFKRAAPDDLRQTLVRAAGANSARMEALWRRWFEEEHGDQDVGRGDLGAIAGGLLGGDADALGGLLGGQGLGLGPGALGSGSRARKGKGRGSSLPPGALDGLPPDMARDVEQLLQGLQGGEVDAETLMRLMLEMNRQLDPPSP